MNSPYRTTCERCHDLEASLKATHDAKDRLLTKCGGLEEELKGYKRRTWTSMGERLLQTIIFGSLLGGAVLLGNYVHGWAEAGPVSQFDAFHVEESGAHL